MRLDREQFLKAVKFLKPAILVSDNQTPMTYLHVKVEREKCQLTATDHYCGKRAILLRPITVEDDNDFEPEFQEYLITKPSLEAFETLCAKHKKKLEAAGKRDPGVKLIDISDKILESNGVFINYKQPAGLEFPMLESFFEAPRYPIGSIKANPSVVLTAFKEFDARKEVEITMSGHDGPVNIQQEDFNFQAFFLPIRPDETE